MRKFQSFIITLTGILCIVSLSKCQQSTVKLENDFIEIGHRGVAGLAPENTLASVKMAMEQGFEMIEIDVHQTKDNELVVIHDFKLDRTTDGNGLVSEHTLEEIKKLDAGSWFSDDFKGERVPTLSEVIDLVNGEAKLLIEIKKKGNKYSGIDHQVVKVIKQKGATNWCVVQSFNLKVLKGVHELDPAIELHKLMVGRLVGNLYIDRSLIAFNPDENEYISAVNINRKMACKSIINRLHKSNKQVFVWTVDNDIDKEKLIQRNADGIITNVPYQGKN